MRRVEVKEGTLFGRLKVLREAPPHIQPNGAIVRQVFCQCSCGTTVKVSLSNLRRGTTTSCGCFHKENHRKYNTYEFGDGLVKIFDLKGVYALIDLADFEKCKDYYWGSYNSYFKGNIEGEGVWLHRFLTNCPKGMVVDHINGNPQDNRRCNLRVCTQADNMQNKFVKGYSFNKAKQKWEAYIGIDNKRIYLGSFATEQEAIEARRNAENIYYKKA